MKRIVPILIAGLITSLSAQAGMVMEQSRGVRQDKAAVFATGVVRKINKAQGKLTIRHGPLENLNMPPMTMAFRAADPAILDRVRPGESIRFHAEMRNGQMVASQIEPVN